MIRITEIEINKLKYLAIEASDNLWTNEDLRKRNLTKDLPREIENILKAKELINIQIIGEVTSGKSISAYTLRKMRNRILKKEITIPRIKSDQTEFGEYIRECGDLPETNNKSPANACTQIDEWSELATTGAGATTEDAYLTWLSDVSAQKYYHRISCSPSTIVDNRANIVLEVIGKDVNTKTNRVLVNYRIIKPEGSYTQLIGYADIFVGEALQDKVYLQYREKKMARINLMNTHGIQNPRELEQAEIVLEIYNELKEYAKVGVSQSYLKLYLKEKKAEKKQLQSIILTEEMVSDL